MTRVQAVPDGTARDDDPVANDFALVVRPLPSSAQTTNGQIQPGANTATPAAGAVSVLAANPIAYGEPGSRLTAIIQNKGTENICIGPAGVTAVNGLRLIPDAIAIFDNPNVVAEEFWAIGEVADSITFAQEIILPP